MLLTNARPSPCMALASGELPSQPISTLPCSTLALVSRGISIVSLPLGPSADTWRPFTSTLTLAGMTTGCFPMRDMVSVVSEIPVHHTWQSTSPPRFLRRASVPLMTPSGVDITATPSPPRTLGISVAPT